MRWAILRESSLSTLSLRNYLYTTHFQQQIRLERIIIVRTHDGYTSHLFNMIVVIG